MLKRFGLSYFLFGVLTTSSIHGYADIFVGNGPNGSFVVTVPGAEWEDRLYNPATGRNQDAPASEGYIEESYVLTDGSVGGHAPVSISRPSGNPTPSLNITYHRDAGEYTYRMYVCGQTSKFNGGCVFTSSTSISRYTLGLSRANSYSDNYTLTIPENAWSYFSGNSGVGTLKESYVNLAGSGTNTYSPISHGTSSYAFANKLPGIYSYELDACGTLTSSGQGCINNSTDRFMLTVEVEHTQTPHSSVVDFNRFDIYYGDFNFDGVGGDIYFHGKELFVPIMSGDIMVPIILEKPTGFVYYNNGDGYSSAINLNIPDEVLPLLNKADNADFEFSDFNQDGVQDIFLRGETSSSNALFLFGSTSNAPTLANLGALGGSLSNRSNSLYLFDVDANGSKDFVVFDGANQQINLVFSLTSGNQVNVILDNQYEACNRYHSGFSEQ